MDCTLQFDTHERTVSAMIYICTACKYTFTSGTRLDRCPDCGKQAVHPATEAEVKDYERIQRELLSELRGEMSGELRDEQLVAAHCAATP